MISVNNVTIDAESVYQEMQYHPAPSKEAAEHQAAVTLVVGELLRQRASDLGLNVRHNDEPTADDDHIELLIQRDVHIPEATDAECRTYYEANQDRFYTSPLLDVSHILIAGDPKDEKQRAYAHDIAADPRSDYASFVPRWQKRFDSRRLLFLPNATILADPKAALRKIEAFANLEKEDSWGLDRGLVDETGVTIPAHIETLLAELLAPQSAFLTDHFGMSFAAQA